MQNEINLLEYWQVIVKRRKPVIWTVGVATCLAIIVSLVLPKVYKAKATILPMGGGPSLSMPFGQAASGMLGGILPVSSSPQIMAILNSRTLAEKIIEKYGLMKILFAGQWDEKEQKWANEEGKAPQMESAVKALFSKVSFDDNKLTQLIEITCEMNNPKLAAEVTNGYLRELANYINENTVTVAKKNRIFIGEQLERNKMELLESGKELSKFYSANRISNVTPTVDVDVSIEAKTEDLIRKITEVDGRIRKAKVVSNIPQQVYLQYLTTRRELLNQVNALLTQRYETAKIEEAKEDLNFQVIDWAATPVAKFKPKRAQIVIVTFFLSVFSALVYVFFREYLEKLGRV